MNNIKTEYHKVVDILVFNQKGQLLLQKRASSDKSFPGHWDFSAGGHVEEKEKIEKAAEREVFEELGISGQITFILQDNLHYQAWKSKAVRNVNASFFKMIYDKLPKIKSKEIDGLIFCDIKTIQDMIEGGEKFHPEFILSWKKGIIEKESIYN